MYLEKIFLSNFKNYEEVSFEFSPALNCILGENGSGKTNLLDAVYFLGLSKSAFSSQDALSIRHEADYMMLDGFFNKNERKTQITCSLMRGQRKLLMHDKKQYERLSEHIGRFPMVMIAPDDTDLIKESSEERRRFVDSVMAQTDSDYLNDYQQYNRILEQRNGLLKLFYERSFTDFDLLETYNVPLLQLAQNIHQQRSTFLQIFTPIFQKHYQNLSEGREDVALIYESEVGKEGFEEDFRRNQARDIPSQRTNMGVHKDDFLFQIDGHPIKKVGSQGQKKAFIMALRLAQYDTLARQRNTKPILLLDDIFDKLDDRRIEKLIEFMNSEAVGQVFLTDARPERTKELLEKTNKEVQFVYTQTP